MEKISKHNYEAFFLDYVEGNLSIEQEQELKDFLEVHPSLRSELDEFELLLAPIEDNASLSTNAKRKLMREEKTALTREDYLMIAATEGQLSPKDKEELDLLLNEDNNEDKLFLYSKSKLPLESIVFENKSSLYRKAGRFIWMRYVSAVAAAAAVLLFALLYNPSEQVYYPSKEYSTSLLGETALAPVELLEFIPTKTITPLSKTTSIRSIPIESPSKNTMEPIFSGDLIESPVVAEINRSETIIETPAFEELEAESQPKDIYAQNEAAKESKVSTEANNKYLKLDEYVIKEIDEELLKNKSLVEFVGDEIAKLTNDQVKYEQEKGDDGKLKKFSLNIGSFGISKF